jgi:enterochelin esterase-like enzyme
MRRRLRQALAGRAQTVTKKFGLSVFAAIVGTLTSCERFKVEPWEKVPLEKNQIEVTRVGEQANLTIERVRFFSEEMNGPRFFLALVPKTEKPLDRVFILNHGWFDRPESLLTYLKVDQTYAGLLAQGKVRPAVIILPDVRFADYFRRNAEKFPFPNYLTLVVEEITPLVSKKYAIPFSREKWGIGGFSFGGYLSLDAARHYPGRFGSVSVVSAFGGRQWSYWPSVPPAPGPLDSKGRGKQTIVEPGPVPRIFLACGTDDRLFRGTRALHEEFTRLGIAHVWSTAPGGHTWEYWSSVLPQMLEFHLAAEERR